MCLICGSRSVPAGRPGCGRGPYRAAARSRARRFISRCSSTCHMSVPPQDVVLPWCPTTPDSAVDARQPGRSYPRARYGTGAVAVTLACGSLTRMASPSGVCSTRAAGQCPVTMARTWRLPSSTSISSTDTPRAWAPVTIARISAAPTPRPCQASSTTTPMSVTRVPRGVLGLKPVHGHGVPHYRAAPDRDHGVDVIGTAGQRPEQGRARRDWAEEAQVAAVRGEPGEEVAERGQVLFRMHLPDRHGSAAVGPARPGCLGSVHELSIALDC